MCEQSYLCTGVHGPQAGALLGHSNVHLPSPPQNFIVQLSYFYLRYLSTFLNLLSLQCSGDGGSWQRDKKILFESHRFGAAATQEKTNLKATIHI